MKNAGEIAGGVLELGRYIVDLARSVGLSLWW
jgi:hypothetical protein